MSPSSSSAPRASATDAPAPPPAPAPPAASADDARHAPPPRLADLSAELLEHILSLLHAPADLAAANGAARLFRAAPPGERSPVERALRARAHARGHGGDALPDAQPRRSRTWTAELFARERVLALAAAHAAALAAGGGARPPVFSAFLTAPDGALYTCGEDEHDGGSDDVALLVGQGDVCAPAPTAQPGWPAPPPLVPTLVPPLGVRLVALSAGYAHLLALSEGGSAFVCGENGRAQLGHAHPSTPRHALTPLPPPLDRFVVCVAAGGWHSVAVRCDGRAYSWGDNAHGQLGRGDAEDLDGPRRVRGLDAVHVGAASGGNFHSLLLAADGRVYSCGGGAHGQLGHGDREERWEPKRVEALCGVRAAHVSAGLAHSLVVGADGSVHSFGAGARGALGHGDEEDRLTPTRVEALAGVAAVRACAGHQGSVVLGADGGVHAFGDNSLLQLGLPGPPGPQQLLPGRAPPLGAAGAAAAVVGCSVRQTHALFATADGAAYSCGLLSGARGHGVALAAGVSHVGNAARIAELPPLLRVRAALTIDQSTVGAY